MEAKPLQPLNHGNVLIVGTKQSNFSDEIRSHPRVIMWDGQNEHWIGKDLPVNVQAVFVTRFISHNAFDMLVREARKKRITIFNPTGTGIIARQVKELLDLHRSEPIIDAPDPSPIRTYEQSVTITETTTKDTKVPTQSKLHVLVPLIDWDKSNVDNARKLFKHEVGATSTLASLANFVGIERKKRSGAFKSRDITKRKVDSKEVDVAVQLLDNMMKELKDMRDYLIATTKENQQLKARVDKLKNFLGGE